MKKLLLLTVLFLFASALLIKVEAKPFNKNAYIDQKVLDMTSPLNVTIDVEFLSKLDPAYE